MRIAFFVSGNGSTFEHLVRAMRMEQMPAAPALLLCSSKKAVALDRAKNLEIESRVVRRRDFLDTSEHADALLNVLRESKIDAICLCGYMELVPPQVVTEFRHRIINIHPALLPAFGGQGMFGRHVHEAVIAYGAKITGATVHFVDEEYDHGPVLAQQALAVLPTDTPESLAVRVQEIEKSLYVGALRLFTKGRVKIDGRKVTILS
ncbi:MAG: phosphoribosylglycinamide formyltransferase [Calditrichaeota bacterium]|nr:phosphoribosylglycinamide formyltransferase [Calditrichota bacterium]MCB9368697.1 phosphoribosylglycinamide formyltransferase [Calditrichota bacterium]